MTGQGGPNVDDPIAPLWKWAIGAISVIGTLLVIFFGWVQLREIPLPSLNAEPTYIRRIIFAFYYACWVAGTTIDANIQKEVYRLDPLRGRIPKEATAAVIGLFAVAAVLLWASDSDERTSLALAPFLLVNIIAWQVLVHRVRPIIARTEQAYREAARFDRLEQLGVVARYITGWWQWARFALMGIIVAAANVLSFNDVARLKTSQALHDLVPRYGVQEISTLLPVGALALFVVVAETWIWILRMRNAIGLRTIQELSERYRLSPR
jgi:hypothetical protein